MQCLLGLLTVLLMVNFSSLAQAASRTIEFNEHVSGPSATAAFEFIDTALDVYTNVYVLVALQRELDAPEPGGPGFFPMAFLSIEQGSLSTGRVAIEAFGSTDDFNFTMTKDMSKATLSAVVPMGELVTHTDFTATINLTWTAAGPVIKDNLHTVEAGHGLIIRITVNGSHREASAEGSVQGLGQEFISGPPVTAEILDISTGFLQGETP